MHNEKIECATPTPGKQPTRIPAWKYRLVKAGIVTALFRHPGVAFKSLTPAVGDVLAGTLPKALGSLSWHVTTVKLDLESKGLIRRDSGRGPQTLRLDLERHRTLTVEQASDRSAATLFDRLTAPASIRTWSRELGTPEQIEFPDRPGQPFTWVHREGDSLRIHDGIVLAMEPPHRLSLYWELRDSHAPDLVTIELRGDANSTTHIHLTCDLHPAWHPYFDYTRATWSTLLSNLAQ